MMSPRQPMPLKSIRIPDKLWQAALDKAAERDESLPEVVRAFLTSYTEK